MLVFSRQVGKFQRLEYPSFLPMSALFHPPIAPGKKIAACVCLLAVTLLWAPLWAAALQTNGMTCCTGAMCPAHRHSPKNPAPASTSSTSAETHMQCDHSANRSSSNSMVSCNMSCCQDQDQSFVAAAIHFVLPDSRIVMPQKLASASIPELKVSQPLHSTDPLSPPPRNASL
jgi:hypothetical protein